MTFLTAVGYAENSQVGTTYDSPALTISGTDKVAWALVINSDGSARANPTGVVLDPTGVNQSFTMLGSGINFGLYANATLWRLIAPSNVTGKIVRATWAAAKSEQGVAVWVETDVDQTTPNGTVVTNTGTSTTLSAGSVSTSTGQRVIHFGHTLDSTPDGARTFDSPSGTERLDFLTVATAYDGVAAQEQTSGGSSVNPQWTLSSAADEWASFAFAVNPVGGSTQAPRSMHHFAQQGI